jgi:hypothetical protein
VSLDEGRSWKQAEGLPDGVAAMIIAHPFDNRYVNNHDWFFFSFLLMFLLRRRLFLQKRMCIIGQKTEVERGEDFKSLFDLLL